MPRFSFLASVSALVLSLLPFSFAEAAPPQFRSLEAGFRRFVQESEHADFETQLKNWSAYIESEAPEVYANILAPRDGGTLESSRRQAAAAVFPFLFANQEAILARFASFSTEGTRAILRLSEQYPEVDLSQVEVWALPSLNKFNGQVTTVDGRVRALFGMDMIEQIRQRPEFKAGAVLVDNMPVLMTHEFSHALHFVMSDFGSPDHTTASFWGPLWDEGLAQVNSQLLVSGVDLPTVYMERNLARACTPENVRAWSRAYLEDAKLDETGIDRAYERWFMLSAGLEEHGAYRAGYCLGYQVILSALQTHSMREILAMSRQEAYALGQATLRELARP